MGRLFRTPARAPVTKRKGLAHELGYSCGKWKTQVQGIVRQQWGKLTDDDLELIKGKRDELAGRIQERYGIAKDEAERQIDD